LHCPGCQQAKGYQNLVHQLAIWEQIKGKLFIIENIIDFKAQ
jgi:hypothetical protein